MKFLHYYASQGFPVFDKAVLNDSDLADSQLTKEMVIAVISKHASVRPPYVLVVPPSVLYEAHCWNIPDTLLHIVPLPEAVSSTAPLAIATLSFLPKAEDEKENGLVVYIHCRRAVHATLLNVEG
jgi:hypothetical protein